MARKRLINLFDEIDYKIIEELNKNARVSAAKISRNIGVKERTIRERIDRLMDLGVGRMTLVIDPTVFGYGISVDIFVDIEPALEEEITEKILSIPQVCYLANGQNSSDMSIQARFKNLKDMYHFIRTTLPEIPGVKMKDYTLVPKTHRDIYQWIPCKDDFGIS